MDDQTAKIELITMITRVKRSGNREVVDLCETMEKYLLAKPAPVPVLAPLPLQAKFDKKAYQKAYMKPYMAKRRAEARRPKGVS